jgi:hypothetical protein
MSVRRLRTTAGGETTCPVLATMMRLTKIEKNHSRGLDIVATVQSLVVAAMTQLTGIVATTIRRTTIVQNPYRGLDTVPKTGPFYPIVTVIIQRNPIVQNPEDISTSPIVATVQDLVKAAMNQLTGIVETVRTTEGEPTRLMVIVILRLAMAPMIRRTTTTMIQERSLEKVKKVEVNAARQSDSSHVESDV